MGPRNEVMVEYAPSPSCRRAALSKLHRLIIYPTGCAEMQEMFIAAIIDDVPCECAQNDEEVRGR